MPLKIYRRGPVWHYRGTVAGRRLRGSTGATDKDIAARIAATRESVEWKCHLDGPAAVLTFAQAAMLYRAAGKSTRFLEKIEDHWRDTLVKDISAGAIRQAAIDLYPRCSPATRNRQAIVPAQAIINHAAELELCPPLRVRRFPVDKKVRKPASLEWVQRFTAKASPHLGALAWFMFQTGARVSEALDVRWQDVDLKARTVRIGQSKTKSERIAHLPPEVFAALANAPRERQRVFLYATRMAAWKAWRTAIRRAKIEVLSFHCCRHGFATGLLQAGIDIVTVAKLGGWRTPRHVLDTYGHAIEDRTLTNALSGTDLTQAAKAKAKTSRSKRGY
jgi:integrase